MKCKRYTCEYRTLADGMSICATSVFARAIASGGPDKTTLCPETAARTPVAAATARATSIGRASVTVTLSVATGVAGGAAAASTPAITAPTSVKS